MAPFTRSHGAKNSDNIPSNQHPNTPKNKSQKGPSGAKGRKRGSNQQSESSNNGNSLIESPPPDITVLPGCGLQERRAQDKEKEDELRARSASFNNMTTPISCVSKVGIPGNYPLTHPVSAPPSLSPPRKDSEDCSTLNFSNKLTNKSQGGIPCATDESSSISQCSANGGKPIPSCELPKELRDGGDFASGSSDKRFDKPRVDQKANGAGDSSGQGIQTDSKLLSKGKSSTTVHGGYRPKSYGVDRKESEGDGGNDKGKENIINNTTPGCLIMSTKELENFLSTQKMNMFDSFNKSVANIVKTSLNDHLLTMEQKLKSRQGDQARVFKAELHNVTSLINDQQQSISQGVSNFHQIHVDSRNLLADCLSSNNRTSTEVQNCLEINRLKLNELSQAQINLGQYCENIMETCTSLFDRTK